MEKPGRLVAIDIAGSVRWEVELRNQNRPLKPALYAQHLAVGLDGRVYCGGCQIQFGGSSPAVFAVADGKISWIAEPQGYPSKRGQFCGGVALYERDGAVREVYASTTHLRITNGEGGGLYALDPGTGRTLAEFTGGIGGMTAPVVDAAGTVYVGIRGKHPFGRTPAVNGRVFAWTRGGGSKFRPVWEFDADGQLDWAAPAIGAKGSLYFGSTAPVSPILQVQFFKRGEDPKASPKFYGIFE